MPIDPSIILGIKSPQIQFPDQAESYGRAMQIQNAMLQGDKARREMAADERFRALFAGNPNATSKDVMAIDPARGLAMRDHEQKAELNKSTLDKNAIQTALEKAKYLRDALVGVTDQPTYDAWRQTGAAIGAKSAINAPPQFSPEWKQQNIFNADKWIEANKPVLNTLNNGQTIATRLINPATGAVTPVDSMQRQQTPDSVASRASIESEGDKTRARISADNAASRAQSERHFQERKGNAAGGALESTLPQDALDMAASRYLINQTLPPNMGRGAQGTANTTAILQRAAAMAKEKGMDGAAASISATANKALATALGGLERNRANVMAYEKTALAGADIAIEMSGKVTRDTGVPIIDKWVQAGRKNVLGDPDITRLQNAVETLTNEYAKVMSGSSGGQATTVSMQQHAREMLSANMTPVQFKGVVELMKREMTETREKAFDAQIEEMKARMVPPSRSSGAPAHPAAAAAAAAAAPTRVNSLSQADPAKYSGQVATGDDGIKYKSDGKRWVRQ